MQEITEQVEREPEKMNIWLSIWYQPRKTVRYAIEHKNLGLAMILVSIAGIIQLLDQSSAKSLGESLPVVAIIVMSIIGGPIIGLIGWLIGSGLNYLVGRMFGGKGTYAELRMAFGISSIILVWGGLVWIPDLIILGKDVFTDQFYFSSLQYAWLFLSLLLNVAIGVWAFTANVFAVAEAHRFSAWKGLLTVLIPVIIIMTITLIVVFSVMLI